MAKFDDLSGRRFGSLAVTAYAGPKKFKSKRRTYTVSMWRCLCDCGTETVVMRCSLIQGATTSCGCSTRTANGDSQRGKITPEYHAWRSAIKRCESTKDRGWHNYGGRGIKMCARWRNDYRAFLADMGRKPSARHSLDRIDNNGDYEPGNVRWATPETQIANRRPFQRKSWREAATHAYAVVSSFEQVIASYTGAPYAVSVDSCTAALLLSCKYLRVGRVEIPRFTYCSVPMSIVHAGGTVAFRDEAWLGMYKLKPYPIYDSARLFTSGMYVPGSLMCLSFHWSKHLPIGRGGAILCDDRNAVEWFKRARFDGRQSGTDPKRDDGLILGHHYYLTPPLAAQGLMLMASIREHNEPLPNSDYPDLSQAEIFQ